MLAAVAVIALGACGDDDEAADTTTAPQQTGTAETGAATEDTAATATETQEDQQPAEQPAEPEECVYVAPEGRLAEGEIVIELSGVDCDQGRSLARAAALGQPAGANLTIDRDGFHCVPSTAAKGANVTYSCTMGSAEATFDVVWSTQG